MAEPEPRYYTSKFGSQVYVQDRLYARTIVRTHNGAGAKARATADCERMNKTYEAWLEREGHVACA